MLPRAHPIVVAVALGWGATAGCGPSYQALYEGDAKFERCYALDEHPGRPMAEKATCWREWQDRHTFGQTRDRAQYAAARYRALSRMGEIPTDEALMQAAPGEIPEDRNVRVAPVPTSIYAPPPRVLGEADGGMPAPQNPKAIGDPTLSVIAPVDAGAPAPTPAPPASTAPPGRDCGDQCAESWRACADKADACEKGYRKCMRVCFK
jgi:hypothetical protein